MSIKSRVEVVFGLLLCISCTVLQDDLPGSTKQEARELIISAYSDEQFTDATTKTALDAEGHFVWTPNDEIAVFSAGEMAKFTSMNVENASSARFKGVISFVTGATESDDPNAFSYGLYPYNANATISDGVITTVLPSVQIGNAGSFANNLALAVAKSSSLDMSFKNAYSGVNFEFSEGGYSSVTLSSNNGELIAGTVNISFDGNGLPVTTVTSGSSSVQLLAPDGGTFETGRRYYILCAPQALSGGFTLTAEKSSGNAVFQVASSQNMERNIFKRVTGNLNERAQSITNNIRFQDVAVKALCVANWDTNSDGEISYTEAAAVADLGSVFQYRTTIEAFNELRFFTGLTSIPNRAFVGCSKLTSVIIPEGVTDIMIGAFGSCSALAEISFPSTIKRIYAGAFGGCNRLEEVVLPEGFLEFVGDESMLYGAFYECHGLKSINFPSTLTNIGAGSFRECLSLGEITLPAGLKSIGQNAFLACGALEEVILPSSLSSLGNYAFALCEGLTSLSFLCIIPIGEHAFDGCVSLSSVSFSISPVINKPQSIGRGAFKECTSLTSITFPPFVNEIGREAFSGCNQLHYVTFSYYSGSDWDDYEAYVGPVYRGVSSIGAAAFAGCPISDLTLPRTIANIETGAFTTEIRRITVEATTPPTIDDTPFVIPSTYGGQYIPMTIAIPTGTKSAYREKWPVYKNCFLGGEVIPDEVDLGLSVKWASWNLGADAPDVYGDYYAWGEYLPKEDYSSWSTYVFGASEDGPFSRYVTNPSYGDVDNKTTLATYDDAANVQLGGTWRMPTYAEWEELLNNCTWTPATQNGVNGYTVSGNGNSIFLPAAGFAFPGPTSIIGEGNLCWYWSSSLYNYEHNDCGWAYYIDYPSYSSPAKLCVRYMGHSVRPVCP